MNVFLISPVRTKVSEEEQAAINAYVAALKQNGHRVYWPLYDTDQVDGVGLRICTDNLQAIEPADEVHFWWNPATQGGIFDFGMAFALRKKIVLANPRSVKPTPYKSFENVLIALDKTRPVTAAIIQHKGKFLIAKRNQESHLAGKWEFPGGKVEPGENLYECLVREIKEELGLDVEVGELFGVAEYNYDEGPSIRLYAFLCRIVRGELECRQHTEIRWVTNEELSNFDFAPADLAIVERLSSRENHR